MRRRLPSSSESRGPRPDTEEGGRGKEGGGVRIALGGQAPGPVRSPGLPEATTLLVGATKFLGSSEMLLLL